jgi:hypothetical protein
VAEELQAGHQALQHEGEEARVGVRDQAQRALRVRALWVPDRSRNEDDRPPC